jgi:hypothetical protein
MMKTSYAERYPAFPPCSDGVLNSWLNLRGDPCRRSLVDPCHVREMLMTVLVDPELVEQPVN